MSQIDVVNSLEFCLWLQTRPEGVSATQWNLAKATGSATDVESMNGGEDGKRDEKYTW
ncbi:hypothetical protein [Alicyclobacillus sp. SO9]|uniref:hypothetical protein n=1 Tax=Alicyclobacillus sp. SO9 TaxID=2665646 RepID=UPI0018E7A124|nr:hypothetical protein [Alicyclobacillus sp. SO9]